jgi:serine/threonine protein kinase
MYHPQTISVNNTSIEIEWSARMLKVPAKVVAKKGRVVFVLSKSMITSIDEISQVVSDLFETKKVYITDCGKLHIRGKKIGSGGFSTIYECLDDTSLVIKVCKNHQGLKEEIFAYRMMEKAHQKFIPEFKGCVGDECILISRYETDLFSLINKIPQEKICSIIVDVIQCLRFIHSIGFVHCDIKPGNILLGMDGHAVLGDLGLARQYVKGRRYPDKKNKRYGTLTYMSGDIHAKALPTRRSDMESLGWMIVELFGGQLPWKGLRDIETVGLMKKEFQTDIDERVISYLSLVQSLGYNDEPKYHEMIKLFTL